MKVVITAAAKSDLLAIRHYIATDNPTRAYPLVPRYERFGIRRYVHGDHLIVYRLQPRQIEVIHILQGVRDIEALLFGAL